MQEDEIVNSRVFHLVLPKKKSPGFTSEGHLKKTTENYRSLLELKISTPFFHWKCTLKK